MQTTRVWGYLAQSGKNLSAKQVGNINEATVRITEVQAERAAVAGSSAIAKGALGAARGGSILVGLFFMRETLEKAWKGQTAWEEEQRHAGQR